MSCQPHRVWQGCEWYFLCGVMKNGVCSTCLPRTTEEMLGSRDRSVVGHSGRSVAAHQAWGQKVVGSVCSRNSGGVLFSRVNFLH